MIGFGLNSVGTEAPESLQPNVWNSLLDTQLTFDGDVMANLPTNYRTTILAIAIAFFLSASATAQLPMTESSVSAVPSNALAFVHIDVEALLKTPGLRVPAEIVASVKKEMDELIVEHLGIKPSELSDVTYALSPEAFMESHGGNDPVGFGIFRFSQPVDFDVVQSRLPHQWRPTKIGSLQLFVNKQTNLSLFHNSANTLVLGTESGVRWFIKYRGNLVDNGIRNATAMTKTGHLTIGINGDGIPSEAKALAPPEFKPFINAKTAAINFDFSDGVAASARIDFNNKNDAEVGLEYTNLSVEKLKTMMTLVEADSLQQMNSNKSDLAIASQHLGTLAMVRYGTKMLAGVKVEQNDTSLVASADIDFDAHLAVLVCLSAIQAVGTAPESEFNEIASELEAVNIDAE